MGELFFFIMPSAITERNRLVDAPRPLTPLVMKSAVMGTGAQASDDTDFENTKRPTNRGTLVPGLITVLLSVLINFIIISAAVQYDHHQARPPPPPPPPPPSPEPPGPSELPAAAFRHSRK